jgi:L-threonylcarbamoyladenylate synthase
MKVTLSQAKSLLLKGNTVALPTETVYGLAACYDNVEAVESIFQLKKRPRENPLIVHLHTLSSLQPFVEKIPEVACGLSNPQSPPHFRADPKCRSPRHALC